MQLINYKRYQKSLSVFICVNPPAIAKRRAGLWLVPVVLSLLTGCIIPAPSVGMDIDHTFPRARVVRPPLPPGKCELACARIKAAQEHIHFSDKITALKEIARSPDLNLHEQLHLINASLEVEIFGMDELFLELARNRYLKRTSREYLFRYLERTRFDMQGKIFQALVDNPGMPDELTPMEKLWCEYFVLDYHQVLDFHRMGYQTEEILTVFFIAHYAERTTQVITDWREKMLDDRGTLRSRKLWWYEVAVDRLRLDPAIFFVSVPAEAGIPLLFRHAYEIYQKGFTGAGYLTDQEIYRLIQLKIINDQYDIPALEIMNQIAAHKTFDEIIKGRHKRLKKTK